MVLRLVACLVIGGLALSAVLSIIEMKRSSAALQMEVTQQLAISARNLQGLLQAMGPARTPKGVHDALALYAADPRVMGVRLLGLGEPIVAGQWPQDRALAAAVWTLPEHGVGSGTEVALDRLTRVQTSLLDEGKALQLELLVDGPAAGRQVQARTVNSLAMQWLLLAIMSLLGLLLMRRWFTGPLLQIVALVSSHPAPEPFYEIARQKHDEFGRLAEAIGGMLTRLYATAEQLRQREQALESLYQFAPAAMVSLDAAGCIIEANRRAAELMGICDEKQLTGRSVLDFVRPEDRALLRQTVDRLDLDPFTRCELRIASGPRLVDVLVECAGVRDDDRKLQSVRLSLLDVTRSKQLQRKLSDQGRLLNLIIDHICDGILLVNDEGRIAAINRKLASLLRRRPQELVGQLYEPEHFWDGLGLLDSETFAGRMRQIDAYRERSAQERFETRLGTLMFEGITVHDADGLVVGRMWVVREMSHQEQNQRLLDQQTWQLQAMRRMAQQLADVHSVDELLQQTAQGLREVFEVEMVGLAIRRSHATSRSLQVLHSGATAMLVAPHAAMVDAVEKHLMPQILLNQDVMYWPDPPANLPWAKAFSVAGLTGVAAGPLLGSDDAQGIVWIARRGGERIERHHIHLLESLAPVIAARFEVTLHHERLATIQMTDAITDLPNRHQFDQMIQRQGIASRGPWSIVLLRVEQLRKVNELAGHAAADRLLRRTATNLLRTVRRSCTVARLGASTFGIIAPHTDQAQAVRMAHRLHEVVSIGHTPLPDNSSLPITASVAVASAPEDDRDAIGLLRIAHHRLDLARTLGGNQVVESTPPQRQAV
ncbi:MAG: diguanylate cyclase [Phycisphaeraceae bacterium]